MADSAPKLNVFISYSRRDMDVADLLVDALEERGFAVKIDRRDLPYGEEWQAELADFIHASDAIVWLLTTHSIQSRMCNWEIGEVIRSKKRLVPIALASPLPELPEAIGKIHVLPASGVFSIGAHMDALAAALLSNRKWVKEHTSLADRSREWLANGRNVALLLRGSALRAAESWKTAKPAAQPIADEVLDLILSSRQAETQRQRTMVVGSLVTAAAALGLAGVAAYQWKKADERTQLALEQRASYLGALAQKAAADDKTDFAKNILSLTIGELGSGAANRPPPGMVGAAASVAQRETLDVVIAGRSPLRSAMLSPDSSKILTVAEDGVVAIWNSDSGQMASQLVQKATVAAFSPDSAQLLIAWHDNFSGNAKIVDVASGATLRELVGDVNQVLTVKFSSDGKFCAAATYGGAAHIWNVADGSEVASLSNAEVLEFDPADSTRVVAAAGEKANVWRLNKGAASTAEFTVVEEQANSGFGVRLARFRPRSNQVLVTAHDSVLTYDETGRATFAASYRGFTYDWSVHLWDGQSGQKAHTLTGHTGPVFDAAFSSDGRFALTASFDGTARLWDVETGRQIQVYRGHQGPVFKVAFDASEKKVLTGSDDKTARLWDAASGSLLRVLRGQTQAVHTAQFNAPSTQILVASNQAGYRHCGRSKCEGHDPSLRLWRVAEPWLVQTFSTAPAKPIGLAGDSEHVAVLSDKGVISLRSRQDGREVAAIGDSANQILQMQMSSDGKKLLLAQSNGVARIVSVPGGQTLATMSGHAGSVWSAKFSRDEQMAVTASEDGTVRIWDAATGELKKSFDHAPTSVIDAGFSADGGKVFSIPYSNEAVVWDVKSGDKIQTLSGHTGPVLSAAFNSDGARLVTASDDATLRVWDVLTGKTLHILRGHGKRVTSVQVAPRSNQLLSASEDGTARLWNLATGAPNRVLMAPGGAVNAAGFSADESFIVTGSATGATNLWDAASGESLVALDGQGAPVSAALSLEDEVVTASADATVRIWKPPTSPKDALAFIEASATEAMSPSELREVGLPDSFQSATLAAHMVDSEANCPAKQNQGASADARRGEAYWKGDCGLAQDWSQAFLYLSRAIANPERDDALNLRRVLALRGNLARRLPIGQLAPLLEKAKIGARSSQPSIFGGLAR